MATKTSVTMTRKQAAEQANLAKRREVCGFFFKKKKLCFFVVLFVLIVLQTNVLIP